MPDNRETPLVGTRQLTTLLGTGPLDLVALAPEGSPDWSAARLVAKATLAMDDAHGRILNHLRYLRQALPADDARRHSMTVDDLLYLTDYTEAINSAAHDLVTAHQHLTDLLNALGPQLNALLPRHADTPAATPTPTRTPPDDHPNGR